MEIFEKHFIFDFDRLFDTAPQSPLPYREEWVPVTHPAPGGAIKPLWQQKALQDCPKRPQLIQFLFPMAAIQGKTIKVFAYAQCCDQQNMNDKTRVEQVYVVR